MPFEKEYPYLGIIFQQDMTFKEHFKKMRNKEYAVGDKCERMFKHKELPVSLKLKLTRVDLRSIKQYGIEVAEPDASDLKEINKRDIKFLKDTLGVHSGCGHTLPRLMCNWTDYETTAMLSTANTLNKNHKMEDTRYPKMLEKLRK